MNTFLRLGSITILGSLSFAAPVVTLAGDGQYVSVPLDSQAYLFHSSSPSRGYLGVDIKDVDTASVGALKLKEAKGAVVVTVDHDAPAAKSGIKINDVILQMNGQSIEGIEQLRRMLRETPAGHTVAFVISRDGVQMTINVQLADRAVVAQQAWEKLGSVPPPNVGLGFSGNGNAPTGLGTWFTGRTGSLHVGAVLNPLTPELATFFGVKTGTGLLVASVDKNSPAAGAGLKVGDVVLKINQDAVATRADWERVMRENIDKPVQITVVRDKKEQTLTMQPSSTKTPKKGDLEWPEFGDADSMVASIDMAFDFEDAPMREEFLKSFSQADAKGKILLDPHMAMPNIHIEPNLQLQMKALPLITIDDIQNLEALPDLVLTEPMD
jgi:serine protease Do